jgi:hypothetical protein
LSNLPNFPFAEKNLLGLKKVEFFKILPGGLRAERQRRGGKREGGGRVWRGEEGRGKGSERRGGRKEEREERVWRKEIFFSWTYFIFPQVTKNRITNVNSHFRNLRIESSLKKVRSGEGRRGGED